MTGTNETDRRKTVQGLYDRAVGGEEDVTTVAGTVTSGKRWEYTHAEIADIPFVIFFYTEVETQYGPAYVADCEVWGEEHKVLIGGEVLMPQLKELAPHLPMFVKVIRPGKAYTFDDPTPAEMDAYAEKYLS